MWNIFQENLTKISEEAAQITAPSQRLLILLNPSFHSWIKNNEIGRIDGSYVAFILLRILFRNCKSLKSKNALILVLLSVNPLSPLFTFPSFSFDFHVLSVGCAQNITTAFSESSQWEILTVQGDLNVRHGNVSAWNSHSLFQAPKPPN